MNEYELFEDLVINRWNNFSDSELWSEFYLKTPRFYLMAVFINCNWRFPPQLWVENAKLSSSLTKLPIQILIQNSSKKKQTSYWSIFRWPKRGSFFYCTAIFIDKQMKIKTSAVQNHHHCNHISFCVFFPRFTIRFEIPNRAIKIHKIHIKMDYANHSVCSDFDQIFFHFVCTFVPK